jgi:DNA (cytosine-5)-methyltransferase 1
MNGVSVCAGIGGLDLGVELALGRPFDACLYVERELGAAAILAARMAAGDLAPGPIWDDVETAARIPGIQAMGCDVVTAGIPCQPFSVAGKGLGLEDKRWLGEAFLDLIRVVGPSLVVVENVPGFALRGAARICGGLSEMGFDAEWGLFSAGATVGAPHRRERFFLVAWRVSDAERGRHLADAYGGRCEGEREQERPRIEGESGGLAYGCHPDGRLPWPPGPDDRAGWIEWLARGWPAPALESPIRRGSDGLAPRLDERSDRLRALGNAVVPDQAAYSIRALLHRAGIEVVHHAPPWAA